MNRIFAQFRAPCWPTDILYVTNEYGVVYAVAAADKFELLATNDMDDRMLATPAIADRDLFLRTDTQLYCVGGASEVASTDTKPTGQ